MGVVTVLLALPVFFLTASVIRSWQDLFYCTRSPAILAAATIGLGALACAANALARLALGRVGETRGERRALAGFATFCAGAWTLMGAAVLLAGLADWDSIAVALKVGSTAGPVGFLLVAGGHVQQARADARGEGAPVLDFVLSTIALVLQLASLPLLILSLLACS